MQCPEKQWQQMTLQGNQLFQNGRLAHALNTYEQARDWALSHFDRWGQSDDAIAAVVVSFLNLSEAQARNDKLQEGADSLCTIHASLLQAQANHLLDASTHQAAASHLRETYAAMRRFQSVYADCPQLQAWLAVKCMCAKSGSNQAAPPTASVLPLGAQPTLH